MIPTLAGAILAFGPLHLTLRPRSIVRRMAAAAARWRRGTCRARNRDLRDIHGTCSCKGGAHGATWTLGEAAPAHEGFETHKATSGGVQQDITISSERGGPGAAALTLTRQRGISPRAT